MRLHELNLSFLVHYITLNFRGAQFSRFARIYVNFVHHENLMTFDLISLSTELHNIASPPGPPHLTFYLWFWRAWYAKFGHLESP